MKKSTKQPEKKPIIVPLGVEVQDPSTPAQKEEWWENRLNDLMQFVYVNIEASEAEDFHVRLRDFIHSLLQKERQRIREGVEKMKVGPWKKWIAATKPYGGTREEWTRLQEGRWDEALDQVIKLLEDKDV